MKIGLNLADRGAELPSLLDVVGLAEAEELDCIWLGEAYGSEAISALGYLAGRTRSIGLASAVLQVGARTPANTAMAAMTLDHLSGGRLRLGLGVSGPQVMEGWHGTGFEGPLLRLEETIQIIRKVIQREAAVTFSGVHHHIPYSGPGATIQARPLRSSLKPLRNDIPIYVAALGPRMVAKAAELATGWLPIFYSPTHEDICSDGLEDGLTKRTIEEPLDIVASPMVSLGASLAECMDELRPMYALYIGGMGARGRNYYFDLMVRYGFEGAAHDVQRAYLAGDKSEAAKLVPDAIIDATALVGPEEHVTQQLEVWGDSRVSSIAFRATTEADLRTLLKASEEAGIVA